MAMTRIVGGPFDGSFIQGPKRSDVDIELNLRSGGTRGRYKIQTREGYPGQLDAIYQGDPE